MSKYTGIQREHQLKNLVFDDYFDSKKFSWEQEVDNIDFIVTNPKTRGDLFADGGSGASTHYLWGEAKKGTHDVFDMFTQLLLTCKKTYDKGDHLAPPWLCCFDEARISFVPFHDILPLFNATDINWTQTPSNHETKDFEKAQVQVKNLIGAKIIIFNFGADDRDIKTFVKAHIGVEGATGIKSPITKDNFVQIYYKWINRVKPAIDVSSDEWTDYKKRGILECDFFIADMMSEDGNSLANIDDLKITLVNNQFKFKSQNEFGRLAFSDIGFNDGGNAHTVFWNQYKRPPLEEAQNYIINRRDIFVPGNLRQLKGSYFTPLIWVQKSQEYLAKTFGDNWQEEYYVWDCAAGTGNLLAGLTNPYNVWASDIDDANVERMNALSAIDDELNLLSAHIFQFDFLNDSFDKLPEELKKIIDDPEKRKKLIVYINPPYVEARGEKGTRGNTKGANQTLWRKKCDSMGKAGVELYAQFLARIYVELRGCKIGEFSKLKVLCAPNFREFRSFFNAKLKKCFVVRANTFDNVQGIFPIGFKIWDTDTAEQRSVIFKQVTADVLENDGIKSGTKKYYAYDKVLFINDWTKTFTDTIDKPILATLIGPGNDFQHNNSVWLCKPGEDSNWFHFQITRHSLAYACVYFAVRHCIEQTWLNDRDQFLCPSEHTYLEPEFVLDCVVFTLFHSQNRVSCSDCTNYWIPFTEKQVGAKEKFESNLMSEYLKNYRTLDDKANFKLLSPSPKAQAVLDAGLELWHYYHAKIKNIRTASVNASFYDIRSFFQGRDDNGKMNTRSEDETYNGLIKALRDALKTLAEKIQPKVYEYGFLKE
ncbi:MAG: hypothetical protein MdMp014T_0845 [Treponematales bacterium]